MNEIETKTKNKGMQAVRVRIVQVRVKAVLVRVSLFNTAVTDRRVLSPPLRLKVFQRRKLYTGSDNRASAPSPPNEKMMINTGPGRLAPLPVHDADAVHVGDGVYDLVKVAPHRSLLDESPLAQVSLE